MAQIVTLGLLCVLNLVAAKPSVVRHDEVGEGGGALGDDETSLFRVLFDKSSMSEASNTSFAEWYSAREEAGGFPCSSDIDCEWIEAELKCVQTEEETVRI